MSTAHQCTFTAGSCMWSYLENCWIGCMHVYLENCWTGCTHVYLENCWIGCMQVPFFCLGFAGTSSCSPRTLWVKEPLTLGDQDQPCACPHQLHIVAKSVLAVRRGRKVKIQGSALVADEPVLREACVVRGLVADKPGVSPSCRRACVVRGEILVLIDMQPGSRCGS